VQSDAWRPFFSLALPLLFVQTVAIGYRDIPMLLLPAILFSVSDGGDAGRRQGASIDASGSQNFRP
jgi:hypothetical protein